MLKQIFWSKAILIFLIQCTGITGTAQVLLDTITVTSTGLPQKSLQSGRNISIIKADDIRTATSNSLDDLLRYVPGIEVQSRSAFGAQGDISMRGSTYTQVLVLVDGLRINDPLTGHFNSNLPVTAEEIERIEILRGPSAAIYGADAVGGVINIVTKTFAASGDPGNDLNGEVSLGQHGLTRTSVGLTHVAARYQLTAGVSSSNSRGQLIPSRTVPSDGEEMQTEAYRNHFDIKTSSVGLKADLGADWTLSARSAFDTRDFDARYYYTVSPFDQSEESVQNWRHQIGIQKRQPMGVLSFQVSAKRTRDEFIFSPDFPSTNRHRTDMVNARLTQDFTLQENLRVLLGVEHLSRSIESNDRGNHSDGLTGIFTSWQWQTSIGLVLTPSARMEWHKNFGSELSPQLNLSYELSDLVLRASLGRAIRAPDYTEQYVSYNLSNLTEGRNLGNPLLEAERSWSGEVGFDWSVGPSLVLKGTYFYRNSNNLVDYVRTDYTDIERKVNLVEGAFYFLAQNIAEVKTRGLEAMAEFRKEFGNYALQLEGGYTFLNTDSDQAAVSVYTSNHARHLLSWSARLSHQSWFLDLGGLYKQRDGRSAEGIGIELSPKYAVWNGEAGLNLDNKKFTIFINVQNIFDTAYQDILGALVPGRWSRAGLKFAF